MFQEYFQQLNNLNESYPLEEVFETHDELNQQLFQDNYLKPEIRKQLLKIVDEFISHLKEDNIPLDVIDYWLLGSNAAYNYGPKSDIDIHIIVNMEGLGVDPYILQILYNYIKSDFNKKYDIEVKGHEIELYIEDVRSGAVTNGIYSLLKDKWVKEPIRTEYMHFDVTETDEYKEWYQRYLELEDSEIEQFINDLYLMRKESLATEGEWGPGNLVFKEFRNLGYLDSLKDRKYKHRSKELTLEGLLDKNKQKLLNDKTKRLFRTYAKEQGITHVINTKTLTIHHIDDAIVDGIKNQDWNNLLFIASYLAEDSDVLHKLLHFQKRNKLETLEDAFTCLRQLPVYTYDPYSKRIELLKLI